MAITVRQTIGEHDYVELTEQIDRQESAGAWSAGTRGTVIGDYGDHKMLDISDAQGVPLDMPVVPVQKLKLIAKHRR